MKKTRLALIAAAAALCCSGLAYAATQSVTANVAFDSPVTITKNNDIEFGTVTASSASTYKITTAGVETTTAGTGVYLYGAKSAGSLKITGSASDTISISTGTYTANNGVTPSAATCAYNGGAETACDAGLTLQAAPGATGKTLLLGVTIQASGTQAAGTSAAPTFVVTVTYS